MSSLLRFLFQFTGAVEPETFLNFSGKNQTSNLFSLNLKTAIYTFEEQS
jgi:hypothetical protein